MAQNATNTNGNRKYKDSPIPNPVLTAEKRAELEAKKEAGEQMTAADLAALEALEAEAENREELVAGMARMHQEMRNMKEAFEKGISPNEGFQRMFERYEDQAAVIVQMADDLKEVKNRPTVPALPAPQEARLYLASDRTWAGKTAAVLREKFGFKHHADVRDLANSSGISTVLGLTTMGLTAFLAGERFGWWGGASSEEPIDAGDVPFDK